MAEVEFSDISRTEAGRSLDNNNNNNNNNSNNNDNNNTKELVYQAFQEKDVDKSIQAHKLKAEQVAEPHLHKSSMYIKNVVFGGLDGVITTFAIVAGLAGADLSPSIVLVFGFANLVADAVSMGYGDFLSSNAELLYAKTERQREAWELQNFPEGEKQEMVEIYMKRGFSEQDARKAIDILATNKEFFIDHMMVQELGLMPPDPEDNPRRDAMVTFFSFLIFGFVCLLAYLVVPKTERDIAFGVSIALTGVTLFFLGVVKGKMSGHNLYVSGLEVLFNGGLAAAASYLIGWGLSEATGINGAA